MKKLQKNMITAGVLLAGGIGVGLYTLENKVKTPEERFRDAQNDRRLFMIGRADVLRGTLQAKNATVAFERDVVHGWKLTAPTNWPADVEAIDAALDRLALITMDTVTSEDATPEEVKRAGLDKPVVTLHVELVKPKDGHTEHTLFVGARNKIADKYPVTNADKKRIGLSEPTFFWAMDRSFDELRSKRLVPFDEKEVTKVSVVEPDGSTRLALERAEDGWTTSGKGQKPIAADTGGVLLYTVAVTKRLTAESFVTDTYDPNNAEDRKRLGFDEPIATLVVSTEDQDLRIVFANNPERPEKSTYAFVEGTATVAEVAFKVRDFLEKTPISMRDRTLNRFDTDDVKRIRFVAAGRDDIVATRNEAKNDWTLGDDKRPAKVWKLDAILRGFAYLKADEIYKVGASPKELTEWLLVPASQRVIFEDASKAKLADIRVGKYGTEDKIFVMADGDERVGLIGEKKIGVLPKGVADLIDEER